MERAATAQRGRPVASDGALTRARIMSAAIELVAEKGYRGATIRQIAARAGLTIGTVFYHFETKAALVGAAHAEVVDPLLERIHVAARAQTGFLPAVVAWLETGSEVLQECPSLARFGAALLHASETDRGVRQLQEQMLEREQGVLRELAEADAAALERTGQRWEAVADAVYAMVIGLKDIAERGDVERSRAAHAAAVGILARSTELRA